MKRFTKKSLAVLLAVVLVLSLSVSALAAWPSFQNTNSNNGVTTHQPPITTPTTVYTNALKVNNPDGSVFTGISTTSVIGGGVAYTLYNGGVTQGFAGGARLQATDISTGAEVWNIQLDAQASNDNQLSTPYYDAGKQTLYAGVQLSTPIYDSGTIATPAWSASSGATISGGTVTFPAGGGTISTTINICDPVSFIYLPTDLVGVFNDGTYTITLDSTTLATGSMSTFGTFDNYIGDSLFAAGNHTLTISVSGNANSATMTNIGFTRYDWRIYAVDVAAATKTMIVGNDAAIDTDYEGQVNTPISYNNNHIYFGIWGGTRSYYQVNKNTLNVKSITADSDGFYWAGAAEVTIDEDHYMVFGDEVGTVYVQQAGADFEDIGNKFALTGGAYPTGPIRSSAVLANDSIYLTSRGVAGVDPATGQLWKVAVSDLLMSSPALTTNYIKSSESSTSTPVISENNILYVGTNDQFIAGTIQAFDPDSLGFITNIYEGDPVQASPIVFSGDAGDYVYFTTNSFSGAGYCYLFDGSVGTVVWTYANAATNPFSAQGMAASNSGRVIWGDDGSNLYIAR